MSNDDKYEIYLQFDDNLDDECIIYQISFSTDKHSLVSFLIPI